MSYHINENNMSGNDRNHTTPLMQYPSVNDANDETA